MKKIISLLLGLSLILGFTSFSYADADIEEGTNVKIVIDGKQGIYSSAPIYVNGSTMLPLREVLVNLGVQNDNDHIAWNNKDKSVTVIKDSIKLYLKIGSSYALVNGVKKKLDASPVSYNGKTYIPARFVAESFGKSVLWDSISSTVVIYNQSVRDKIWNILYNTDNIIENSKGYKMSGQFEIDEGHSEKYNVDFKADMQNKLIQFKGSSLIEVNDDIYERKTQTYYCKGSMYRFDSTWTKSNIEDKDLDYIIRTGELGRFLSDYDLAGLSIKDDPNSDFIVLEGDTGSTKEISQRDEICKAHRKIIINKKTLSYQESTLTIDYITSEGIKGNFTETYYGYEINGDYSVTIPQDAINTKNIFNME